MTPLDRVLAMPPRIGRDVYVHPSVVLVGDVTLADRVSVWPGCVLRGDQGRISIGEESNIQDGTIAHATGGVSETVVGARVTVGHRVVLHGCHVMDDCLVGMGAIVLDNVVVEPLSVIGAGALIPVGRRIPSRSLVVGVPGRVVRTLSDHDIDTIIRNGHAEYLRLAAAYRAGARA